MNEDRIYRWVGFGMVLASIALWIVFISMLTGCGPAYRKENARADLVEKSCPEILASTLRVSEECSKTEYEQKCRPVVRYYNGWPYQTCEYTTQDCFYSRGGERLLQLSRQYSCTCGEGC